MQNDSQYSKWKEILEKFNGYKGTITGFCKANNISKDKFYYYKRKLEKKNSSIFHAVTIEKDKSITENVEDSKASDTIRIEIGKATIIIPSENAGMLSELIKELIATC
ncbi:IS66 family insertion sequence element accessory protein TnpA [Clostridium oryzae]|uniref:IS66 family insertion sequence element accessory protein TnpA n=1 Tax=Clostridium oryzae TaxID=1450648 RepID=UPI003BFA786D